MEIHFFLSLLSIILIYSYEYILMQAQGEVQIYKLYISKRENDETHRLGIVLQNIKQWHNPNHITVFQKSVILLVLYDGCIVNAL